MLLDPFEEQFDLPAAFVERADGRGRQPELVGEEHQLLSRFGVPEADAPQVFGVMLGSVVAVQRDGLIANDAGRAVCGGGIDPMSIHVRFGAGDEEGSGQVQHMEPGEIDIAPIHDVYCARLREQQVERVNVMQFATDTWMKLGMLPRKSNSVCILTAALVVRKWAHGKTARQRSMVVESS